MEGEDTVSTGNQPQAETMAPSDNWKMVEPPLVRPRFEQPFPTSQPPNADMPGGGSTIPQSSIMDRTHAATTEDDAAQSTYSYNSGRDWAMFFKEIDGRRFSNQSSTYILPADDIEFIRLDKQHAAHLIGLGGLYPCPDLVERVLAPESGITKEILDLGCGTGIWALSMARQFPHTRVTGVDMAPTPLGDDQVPSNIVFEIDNINYGLEQFTGRFDLVHMRCTASGLPDFAQATTYAAQCLKPGGLLLLVDLDTQLCAEDMVTIQKIATPNQPDGSWLARYFYEVRSAFDTSGIDTSKLSETLDRALWDHPLLTNCGAGSMFNPVGPWFKSFDPEEKQRLEFAGILMRQNLKAAIQAFHTLFRKKGVPQESIDELTAKAIGELESLKIHMWIRLSLAWGFRKFPDQGQDPSTHGTANEGASGSVQSLPKSNWHSHYRTIHIYKTEEESQAARKLRQDTVGELVEPMVSLVEENQP